MYPPKFGYVRVSSLEEAVNILNSDENAKVLAGGQSLMPLLKLRLIKPSYLVDINRVPNLSYINIERDRIRIGALARHHQFEINKELWSIYPAIPETAMQIGDPQVRNLGTMAGSLAHADPAADWPATLIAFRASITALGPSGERVIPIDDFFTGPFSTALGKGEVIKEIVISRVEGNVKSAYVKLERKAGDFAVVGVAVMLKLGGDGSIEDASIGITAAGPKPFRAREAEKALIGRKPTSDVIEDAAEKAMRESNPISDIRGSSDYKRYMVKVITKRAINKALSR
ncbi:glyceraldehyde dehydrogenase subunit beta [Vulcanisaeta thermophila]|uniref:glyceraldehyde dehydrogenase subunit beta n=1 Tax=Vulcanisaeta thermophila TaxID=867917 RepID=UPI0008538E65|nr:glyceraldehyde dehydrogenase subunit beta [Vulcanisaeta thermophila]